MAYLNELTKTLKQMPKCKDCKSYDAHKFPEYNGAVAICTGKSERYKVGHHSVCCEYYDEN